jgi:hypothetical protein
MRRAYSTQCAGERGVSASVQSGYVVCGGNSHSVHSKQGVIPGTMTRTWPRKPSVPPSMSGVMVDGSGAPSSSNASREHATAFMWRRASSESRPSTMMWKPA